jgi:hypothetical protein
MFNFQKINNKARHGGSALESQLFRRRRSKGSWLETSLGKKFGRLHLNQ